MATTSQTCAYKPQPLNILDIKNIGEWQRPYRHVQFCAKPLLPQKWFVSDQFWYVGWYFVYVLLIKL